MCYPMLIAAGLAAAGAASNYAGQRKVTNEREDVARAEGERQRGFQDRANEVIDQNLVKQSPTAQNQALAQTGEQRTAALLPSQSDAASLPGAGSAPVEVKSEAARTMSDAIRRGRTRLGAQARLGAFNQNQTANQTMLNRGMSDLGQLANFSQGSAGVLPYDLQGAANAGRGWQTAADIFNLGSSAVGLYGQTTGGPQAQKFPTIGPAGTNYSPAPPRAPVSLYAPRR